MKQKLNVHSDPADSSDVPSENGDVVALAYRAYAPNNEMAGGIDVSKASGKTVHITNLLLRREKQRRAGGGQPPSSIQESNLVPGSCLTEEQIQKLMAKAERRRSDLRRRSTK